VTDKRADTSDEAVAKVLRRCYDERELPEWGDFLKASEAIAALSRQLAEAQAAIERTGKFIDELDRYGTIDHAAALEIRRNLALNPTPPRENDNG
jgi:hypothetical protein